MLKFNDKINLSLVNARDIQGNILSLAYSLPTDVSKIDFPDNMVAIDVCEYQEGLLNGGSTVFSIYVGERRTIEDLVLEINNIVFCDNVEIPSIKSPVCFRSIADKRVVLAALKQQDIVVKNIEELRNVLEIVSVEVKIIQNSVRKLQTMAYYGKIVSRNCDNCAYGSYGLDNGKETLYCRVDEYEHDVISTEVCEEHQFIEGLGPVNPEIVSMGSRVLKDKK